MFFFHGTPGSSMGPLPRTQVLYKMGIQAISFDRPGYGHSERLFSRTVADVVPDVVTIADRIGLERFAVVGRSGGGPHALACAAQLPDRVTRAAALVSLAPWGAAGLDWFNGMAGSNVDAFTTAASEPELLITRLVQSAAKIKENPASQFADLDTEMPEPDRRMMADIDIRRLLAENSKEAVRYGADGWIDDVLAFCSPWGFEVSDIRVPVELWAGEKDVFSPVTHTRWLGDRIPDALVQIRPESAHFDALKELADVMARLIR
ncbi:MAG TPA: alpha/beta hydrolase [Trebonia sp.]|nr:alpha/beta hydrolase [Trebonia sp.]